MNVESAGLSSAGRRKNNEDAMLVAPTLGIYAVADGMGGHVGGAVASQLVVTTLEAFRRRTADPMATWPDTIDARLGHGENVILSGVRLAHAAVSAQRRGKLAQMGSTLAALVIDAGRIVVGNVGDSRVYRLRDGRLAQLTRDHSMYAELEAAGITDLGPRAQSPHACVITRAVGLPDAFEADVCARSVRAGDTYLLCTDGLFEGLSDAAIATILGTPAGADELCRALVAGAIAGGSRDNVSAVVLRVHAN